MSNTTQIRTRADGSIDIAYYTARARYLRSQQAHTLIAKASPAPRPTRRPRLAWGLAALLHNTGIKN